MSTHSDAAAGLVSDYPTTVLLVDDQKIIGEAIRRMVQDEEDITFHFCDDPKQAIELAGEIKPTVILQDLVMPDVDGLTLVRYFRANEATENVPLIVLSTKEEAEVKAQAFALGANDYMVKLPDKLELLARIRYHSRGYIRLLQRDEAFRKLKESQEALNQELQDAAAYVISLLPGPLEGEISAHWKYVPSAQLGGDTFGYHWLDDDRFACYLLDVCGHGVGPALHSISALNAIRSQRLQDTDFGDPAAVLGALNEIFDMDAHNGLFFTMWYGVYDRRTRELIYSSGGHPPMVLQSGQQVQLLKTPGMVVGGMPGSVFGSDTCQVSEGSRLFLFSDGVYELDKPDGQMLELDEFVAELTDSKKSQGLEVDRMLTFAREVAGSKTLPDDFSIVQIDFQ